MRKKQFFLLIAAVFLLIVGCAPAIKPNDQADTQKQIIEEQEKLAAEPSIERIPVPSKAFTLDETTIPKELDKQMSVSFNRATLRTILRAVAAEWGGSYIIENEAQDSRSGGEKEVIKYTDTPTGGGGPSALYKESLKRTLSLEFKGSLKDLMELLSQHTGYFLNYKNNALIVSEKHTFSFQVPSYKDLLKEISDNLSKMGAREIGYDEITSRITYTTDYQGQQRIRAFLNDLRGNMSMIALKIVILDLSFTGNQNKGVDWTKFLAAYGRQKVGAFGLNASSTTGTTTTVTTTSTTTGTSSSTFKSGVGIVGNATGINLFLESSRFSISQFFSFIESYGKVDIVQNIGVETLSGKKGKIKSLTKTPYIDQVGVAALSTTAASAQNTATSKFADSGVTMEIWPYYSREQGTVTVSLDAAVLGVTRFIKLDAGNLGTFSQPETTEKSVSLTLRLAPSQTAIIGGLFFDKKTTNSVGMPGDTYLTKSYAGTQDKEELILIVKPKVYEFVPSEI
ncbi:MAG: type II and III secretion system protein [Nitrospirae bacterium]|nr:type II and III secretion system protein [Nitrospirota bacterium]